MFIPNPTVGVFMWVMWVSDVQRIHLRAIRWGNWVSAKRHNYWSHKSSLLDLILQSRPNFSTLVYRTV